MSEPEEGDLALGVGIAVAWLCEVMILVALSVHPVAALVLATLIMAGTIWTFRGDL